MDRIQVADASRKVKRDIQKVFGDNFLKILTEIVLNSDDSYNRIESSTKDKTAKPIVVSLNRKKRIMTVVDQAEGMSNQRMIDIFSRYGGDYSGADNKNNVRGLFGQGASDVMFLSAFHKFDSYLISIKDGVASKCTFYFSNKKEISVEVMTEDINTIRKKTGIVLNGTYAFFGLGEPIRIPRRKTIQEKIESFYMLRYILSNKQRQVFFYDGEVRHRLDSSRYLSNNHKILLKRKAIKLDFDGEPIKSTLMLYEKKPEEPQQIVVRDENFVVYEETMFGLERVHGANYIAGEYIIEGIYDILRDKLNADTPEEILRDSRDGFDKRHRFTIGMYNKVDKIIYSIIEENNTARESISYSLNNNKKLFSALKKINSYFNELELSNIAGINQGNNPPVDGIRFARPIISITKNKHYGLHLYINPSLIEQNKVISIIEPENKNITIINKEITYQDKDIRDNQIVVKSVIIKAERITQEPILVKAKIENFETQVLINVVKEKIIYPENGLEFKPKRKELLPKKSTSFVLYFDTEYIPMKSRIDTILQYESQLFPEHTSHQIEESDLIAETIGKIKIPIQAHDYDEKITIHASYQDITANAVCYVKERKKDDDGNEGLLNTIKLVFEKKSIYQATVVPGEGILQINGEHPINKAIMGPMGNKDPENPDFSPEQLRYLYELVALESSKLYVMAKNLKTNETMDPEELFNEIQEHKTKVYIGLLED